MCATLPALFDRMNAWLISRLEHKWSHVFFLRYAGCAELNQSYGTHINPKGFGSVDIQPLHRSLDRCTVSRFAAADRAPVWVLSHPCRSLSRLTYQMSGRGSRRPERAVARTADEGKGCREAQWGQRSSGKHRNLCIDSSCWPCLNAQCNLPGLHVM